MGLGRQLTGVECGAPDRTVRGLLYAARQRARSSPAFLLHRIAVPLLVRPRAPSGEQNAPGCTPDCDGGRVVLVGLGLGRFVDGFGFGVAVVFFGVALAVVFDGVVVGGIVVSVGVGVGVVSAGVAATGGISGAAVAACSGVFLAAGSSVTSPTTVSPPQHNTSTARVPVRASRHPVSHFGRWRGWGAVGWFQAGCTGTGWTLPGCESIVRAPHVWAIQPVPGSRSCEGTDSARPFGVPNHVGISQ